MARTVVELDRLRQLVVYELGRDRIIDWGLDYILQRETMPSDKYAKRNNKSELWARRRNNTAQQMLDKRIRHLEKEWRLGNKQYFRDSRRVLTGLRELGDTHHYPMHPSDKTSTSRSKYRPDLTTTDSVDSEFFHVDPDLASRPSTVNDKEGDFLSETRFRTSSVLPDARKFGTQGHQSEATHPKSTSRDASAAVAGRHSTTATISAISSIRPSTHSDHQESSALLPPPGFTTSTPHVPTIPCSQRGKRGLHMKTGSRRHKSGACRFMRDGTATTDKCSHFPCKTPLTYHSFGFRREDMIPMSEGLDSDNNIMMKCENSISSFFLQGKDNKNSGANEDNQKTINTSWIKTGEGNQKIFSRVIKGPSYEPAPVDHLLEKIKTGTEEVRISDAHTHARVGIHDRIRGLRQLVKEMKFRNDSVRPPDWAVNYGRRVPTRVLLNPVVPV